MSNSSGSTTGEQSSGTVTISAVQSQADACDYSLQTTFNTDKAVPAFYGIMFSLKVNDADLVLQTLEVEVRSDLVQKHQSNNFMEVYYRHGGFDIEFHNASAWTLLAATVAVPYAADNSVLIPVDQFNQTTLLAKDFYSFYVTMKCPCIDNTVYALDKTNEAAVDGPDFTVDVGSGLDSYKFPDSLSTLVDPKFAGVFHYRKATCDSSNPATAPPEYTDAIYEFLLSEATSLDINAIVDSALVSYMASSSALQEYVSKYSLKKSTKASSTNIAYTGGCPTTWSGCMTTYQSVKVSFYHSSALSANDLLFQLYQATNEITDAISAQLDGIDIYYLGLESMTANFQIDLTGVPSGTLMNPAQEQYFAAVMAQFVANTESTSLVNVYDLNITNQTFTGGRRLRASSRAMQVANATSSATSAAAASSTTSALHLTGVMQGAKYAYATDEQAQADLNKILSGNQNEFVSMLQMSELLPGPYLGSGDGAYFAKLTSILASVSLVTNDATAGGPVMPNGISQHDKLLIIICAAIGGAVVLLGGFLLLALWMKKKHKKEKYDKLQEEKLRQYAMNGGDNSEHEIYFEGGATASVQTDEQIFDDSPNSSGRKKPQRAKSADDLLSAIFGGPNSKKPRSRSFDDMTDVNTAGRPTLAGHLEGQQPKSENNEMSGSRTVGGGGLYEFLGRQEVKSSRSVSRGSRSLDGLGVKTQTPYSNQSSSSRSRPDGRPRPPDRTKSADGPSLSGFLERQPQPSKGISSGARSLDGMPAVRSGGRRPNASDFSQSPPMSRTANGIPLTGQFERQSQPYGSVSSVGRREDLRAPQRTKSSDGPSLSGYMDRQPQSTSRHTSGARSLGGTPVEKQRTANQTPRSSNRYSDNRSGDERRDVSRPPPPLHSKSFDGVTLSGRFERQSQPYGSVPSSARREALRPPQRTNSGSGPSLSGFMDRQPQPPTRHPRDARSLDGSSAPSQRVKTVDGMMLSGQFERQSQPYNSASSESKSISDPMRGVQRSKSDNIGGPPNLSNFMEQNQPRRGGRRPGGSVNTEPPRNQRPGENAATSRAPSFEPTRGVLRSQSFDPTTRRTQSATPVFEQSQLPRRPSKSNVSFL